MREYLQIYLTHYIKQKKNQDQCDGFIEGFEQGWETKRNTSDYGVTGFMLGMMVTAVFSLIYIILS